MLFLVLFMTVTVVTCIDPFSPDLADFESLLVVDALVTDENASYAVKLSRTVKRTDEKPEKVIGARVEIKDDQGNLTVLRESSPGEYRTDSTEFRGVPGRSYILNIITPEGEEYFSEPCLMHAVPEIDTLYFINDDEITSTGSETLSGIRFYIDSQGESATPYFRWTYEEWWKFHVPNPKKYDYINDSTFTPLLKINETCWSYNKSDEIIIDSRITSAQDAFKHKAITFIPTDRSNRFLVRHCILVKQLSLSADEYEFWNQMKQINETGGDIFDKQPFPVSGNIKNKNNPSEQVLGYFQVSGVQQKRIYVTPGTISDMGLPVYRYDCERIEMGEIDYPPPLTPAAKVTFDKIYRWYTTSGYDFIEPSYDMRGIVIRLVFVPVMCSDCTLSGSLVKPGFWTDQE